MILRILSILLLLLNFVLAIGQSHERFYNISRRDGLASGSVTSIVQDHQGLIWIGTKHGINRYDGYDFNHYHSGNSNITSNDITSLLVDSSGQLWIGTNGGGLYYLEPKTQEIVPYENERVKNRIISIHAKGDSSLFVLTDMGIITIDPSDQSTTFDLPAEISMNASALAFDDDSLWIGSSIGDLFCMGSDGSYITYNLKKDLPGMTIQSIHVKDDKTVFIGTRQYGLLILNMKNGSISRHPIEAINVGSIIRDKNGVFWIGSDGHGIYRIDETRTTNFLHKSAIANSLVSNAVLTCFEDRDGNLWFGTAWEGISVIDRVLENLQFIYSDFDGHDESGILNIYIEENNLWLGTDGKGLSIQDPSLLKRDFSKIVPSDSYVQFIDKIDNQYWIGTFQSGLYLANDSEDGRVTHFTSASGLSHDDVRAVEQIDSHQFLIVTWGGGLNLYDKRTEQFRKIGNGPGYPNDVVTLKRISADTILVGSFGQGLFVFNPSDLSLQRILHDINNVVSIGVSKTGVWLGTWGEGLHFSEAPFTSAVTFTSDKISNNANIFSILSSPENDDIWIASSEYIFKIINHDQIKRLLLPPQQFHINSANVDEGGRLYFGVTDGVISFRPEDIELTYTKEVEILGVKVLNTSLNEFETSIASDELIELEHDQNLITFRYATPIYPSSREETYEVQLAPINNDWINVGRERSMTFADLKPGNYVFKVRNSTSLLEEKFQFTILNPWWKTWWAYLIFLSLFSCLLYAFRRYSIGFERIQNQLEIEKIGREKELEISNIKQRFFVNISHEIRTPLTLIIGEIEQLAIKAGGSKGIISSINNLRNNGNHLIQLVNELLDFRKLDEGGLKLKVAQGNFVAFLQEIYLSFLNKADANGIDYQFVSESDEILIWFDRDQLEKVFYNLISNAFKNTPLGGKIELIVSQYGESIQVTVKDTGKGIPENELLNVFKRFYQNEDNAQNNEKGFGIGLSIVHEIINLHHGSVTVDSSVGKGSCFQVLLRLGPDHFSEQDIIPQFQNSNVLSGYTSLRDSDSQDSAQIQGEQEIMIVEDNPDIRNFIKRVLSTRFQIAEASNGLEAYELIQEKLPDLIISDIMMPGMDGITLTKKLKQSSITSHIPVILLTARTGTVFKKEGFETGADDYVTKPFNSETLIARIENIFKSRKILTNQIRNELAIRPDDLNLATPDERFLKDLVKVIQTNLDNSELNSELVASEMGMSHSVIYKKIKALTGYNLVEFIRDYRLQQAAEILSKYKFTVAEACYKVGFSDKKYFSKIFKNKYGVTPSELAKKGD